METIVLSVKQHKGTDRLFAEFPYNKSLIEIIKKVPGAAWSQTNNCWHLPCNTGTVQELLIEFKGIAWIDYSGIKNDLQNVKQRFIEKEIVPEEIQKGLQELKIWMQHKRYSDSTIKTYLDAAKSFLMFIHPKPIQEADNHDMISYVNDYIIKNKLSYAYQNQVNTLLKTGLVMLTRIKWFTPLD
jgi:integrase/recombinase XerD